MKLVSSLLLKVIGSGFSHALTLRTFEVSDNRSSSTLQSCMNSSTDFAWDSVSIGERFNEFKQTGFGI